MSESSYKIHIDGKNRDKIASRMMQIIQEHLGIVPEKFTKQNTDTHILRKADPIAIAAIILSIPSVILATADLVERIKKKQKVDLILKQIQELINADSNVSIRIETPKGRIMELKSVSSTEIIDEASEDSH